MSENIENGLNRLSKIGDSFSPTEYSFFEEFHEKKFNSSLDKYDFLCAFVFGIIGGLINTDEKVSAFLDNIHKLANSKSVKIKDFSSFIAALLHHSGDYIDQVPIAVDEDGNEILGFVNRAATVKDGVYTGAANTPHRIFWGHDIFSLSKDNPFYLEIQQYGFGRGMLQAIRHLLADTFSHQGLPVPGHSFFDYIKKDSENNIILDNDGNVKVGNILLDFCQQYAKTIFDEKQGGFNNEVFNHMFSIHIQDVASQGLAAGLCKAYFCARGIKSNDRMTQMRVVCYAALFLASSIIGAIKYKIPYISWPTFIMMFVQTCKMICIDHKDILKYQKITDKLIGANKELLAIVADDLEFGESTYDKQNEEEMIDFLEEKK